jgi:cold shock CspA family protein
VRGTVALFDEPRGLGVVRGDDGAEYPFHCTAIVDGTRTIDVGAKVEFELRPYVGRYEATAIQISASSLSDR